MKNSYTSITSDMAGCYLSTLAVSRCRANKYDNITNIYKLKPNTHDNAPVQHPNKHLYKIVTIDQNLIHSNHLSPSQSCPPIPHMSGRRVLCAMLGPSGRGELEITDVNNYYINMGRMGVLDACLARCDDMSLEYEITHTRLKRTGIIQHGKDA
jgi:hypothetical protein